jgi:hypothetical protein
MIHLKSLSFFNGLLLLTPETDGLIDAYTATNLLKLHQIPQFSNHPFQVQQFPLLPVVIRVPVEVLLHIGHQIDDGHCRSLRVDEVVLDEAAVLNSNSRTMR